MPATLSGLERGPACHPERSEGSGWTGAQILRCAQDDKIPACHPERSEGSGWTYGESPGALYYRITIYDPFEGK